MLSRKTKMKLINWWPPMLGTGISLRKISDDFTRFEVQIKRRWYNRNLVNVHYGGSLYSMCDPWYMFILMACLGKKYVVWDQAATIRFVKPGKGTVTGIFEVKPDEVKAIKKEIDQIGKKVYTFKTVLTNSEGEVVCEVEKDVYVRKRDFDWEAFNAKKS
ncbi:MAG: DUF4442 domain-containing protein [Fulvivirga sp.]